MKPRLALAALFLNWSWALAAFGEPPKPLPKELQLSDGDTLVFLGDSITHQCLYTQYVEDYFYTRFPKTRLHFHNAGVGGDRARDALARLDEDVTRWKPKYVTILLGMNDGGYGGFNQDVFETYRRDMTQLLDRLTASGTSPVVMSPTMFDSEAARAQVGGRDENRDWYYNGVLALYGAWLREMALDRGLGFVDMHSPLNQITLEQRRIKRDFTLIEDAVHPGPAGQAIMAAALLRDLGVSKRSSLTTIVRRFEHWTGIADDERKVEITQNAGSLSFELLGTSLPWVLPPEAAQGQELARADQILNGQRLRVYGLEPGRYDLLIDGEKVGTYTHFQFGTRIDLHDNSQAPQYRQALAVANLNKERNEKAIGPLRNLWAERKERVHQVEQEADATQRAVRQTELKRWLEDEFGPAADKLQALAVEYEDQIYATNHPQNHRYEIVRSRP